MNTDPLCPQQHTHPNHSPNRCIFCEYGAAVRADALDAAREAVAALPATYKVRGDFDTYGPYREGRMDMKDSALTAIDALRTNTSP